MMPGRREADFIHVQRLLKSLGMDNKITNIDFLEGLYYGLVYSGGWVSSARIFANQNDVGRMLEREARILFNHTQDRRDDARKLLDKSYPQNDDAGQPA